MGSSSVLPQMRSAEQSRLKNLREAAVYLSLCERKVWQLGKDREIPTIRSGKSVRFDVYDLDRWIERQKAAAVADSE
ncbi:MAG TPA: DNA-binding protein [Planctomycetaceae bacterium]|nr:DNA-binding protein [Planctomycetaceae bacterium]|tara:strand:+ start:842 stop:1072 length:231 start_codon:yes stop_codon:yes gene_type:complete